MLHSSERDIYVAEQPDPGGLLPAGHTNSFHIQTQTPLAQRYNDMSVMENHHCALTFAIMTKRDCAILSHLEKPIRQVVPPNPTPPHPTPPPALLGPPQCLCLELHCLSAVQLCNDLVVQWLSSR